MSDTEKRYDIGNVFPGKGDPHRPPEWLGRALLMGVLTVFAALFVWWAWGLVSWIALDLVICFFLALAMEPAVMFLIRHGWKRGAAAAFVWLLVILIIVGILTLFGSMFVQQVIGLVQSVPSVYRTVADYVASTTPWKLPDISDLVSSAANSIQTSWITDVAGRAVSTTAAIGSFFLQLMLIILVTYYICASGPSLRKGICSLLPTESQRRFLVVWTVVQGQISSFLNSRVILVVISSAVMSVFMVIMQVPYWLPLALSYAVISQFIPMVGGIIGAVLPVIVAWSSGGTKAAVVSVIFILVYQQIENMVIAPKIQQRTMLVHPAIGLLAVFAFGAIFGVAASFLALPVTASVQVIFNAYIKRQDLVDSPLLDDPKPVKKSKVVEASEAIAERLIKPVSERLPRAARGSTIRVSTENALRDVEEELSHYKPAANLDESETIAIPKKRPAEQSGTGTDSPTRPTGSKRALWGSPGKQRADLAADGAVSGAADPEGQSSAGGDSASG